VLAETAAAAAAVYIICAQVVQLVPASSFQGAAATLQAAAISQRHCLLGPALALAVLAVLAAEVAVVVLEAGAVAQQGARFSQVAAVLEEEGLAVQVLGAPAVLVVLVVQGVQGLLVRLGALDVAAALLVTPLMALAGLEEEEETSLGR
jgi:hypothetical protein